MDKFLNEARCLTRFNHMAGIVAVQDFFYENETAYIVMDYVGKEMSSRKSEKMVPWMPKKCLCLCVRF